MSSPIVLVFGHRARRGGVPTHLAHLARALPGAGFSPVFALPADVPWRGEIEAAGVPIVEFEQHGKADIAAPLRAQDLIESAGASLIATHSRPVDLWAGLGARLASVPAVSTLHAEPGRTPSGAVSAGLRSRAHGLALRGFHGKTIVVARAFLALARERLGLPEERIAVVENGVDLAALSPGDDERRRARERLGIADGEVAFGYIARFVDEGSEEKGQPDVVRALARTKGVFTLHFVGGGPSEASVRALAEREGCARRVRFHGEVPSPEVVRGLDALVLASRSEGCPYAVLEALAAGVPVVATKTGGLPEILDDGKAGVLVPPGDLAALAASLERLASSEGERRDLAAKGLARARERYSLERFARETAEVYRGVLAARA